MSWNQYLGDKNYSIKNLLYYKSCLMLQSLVKECQASEDMFQVCTSFSLVPLTPFVMAVKIDTKVYLHHQFFNFPFIFS